MTKIIKYFNLLLVMGITVWLRIINLGYSNYQGDEIKALFQPESGQNLASFFLDQRKGPLQFIITFIIKFFNPDYTNEFITRIPFALAGILVVFFFYKLIKIHFGERVALISSFLIATNGFFVAFSRIVQYQSFVIVFMVLTLYLFSLASSNDKWKIKGLYLGFLCWAFSLLAHYDGIFISPFAAYLLLLWLLKFKKLYVKHLILSLVFFILLVGSFYIPFVITLSLSTIQYWQNRITGGEGKISSSIYLFNVYQPIYVLKIYVILVGLGILSKLSLLKYFKSITNLKYIFLALWIICPFVVMEFLINIPGTHIYTYLMPATILAAFGLDYALKTAGKIGNVIIDKAVIAVTILVFLFIFLQTNAIFVDNSKEYPWENEQYLIWNLFMPTSSYHLSMFGFPYFRDWEGIGNYIKDNVTPESSYYYSSNERDSMVRYYVPLDKSTSKPGYRFYIFIENAQSFTGRVTSEYTSNWIDSHDPVYIGIINDVEKVKIYKILNKQSNSEENVPPNDENKDE